MDLTLSGPPVSSLLYNIIVSIGKKICLFETLASDEKTQFTELLKDLQGSFKTRKFLLTTSLPKDKTALVDSYELSKISK